MWKSGKYNFDTESLKRHFTRLNGGVVGGLKNGESIIDYLTDEEFFKIDYITGTYDPLFTVALINKTDEIITGRTDQRDIKHPYKYIEAIKDKYF